MFGIMAHGLAKASEDILRRRKNSHPCFGST